LFKACKSATAEEFDVADDIEMITRKTCENKLKVYMKEAMKVAMNPKMNMTQKKAALAKLQKKYKIKALAKACKSATAEELEETNLIETHMEVTELITKKQCADKLKGYMKEAMKVAMDTKMNMSQKKAALAALQKKHNIKALAKQCQKASAEEFDDVETELGSADGAKCTAYHNRMMKIIKKVNAMTDRSKKMQALKMIKAKAVKFSKKYNCGWKF
jgi:hypothetical protein